MDELCLLMNNTISKMAIVNNTYPVIVLNEKFTSERNRFTAAHELGHIMLTFEEGTEQKEKERLHIFAHSYL